MRKRFGKGVVLLVGATVALAALSVGYGMWSETLQIHGIVATGGINMVFVDNPGSPPAPPITPYSNDDNVVNNAANDPADTGTCANPPPSLVTSCDPRTLAVWSTLPTDEDGDGLLDEDSADGLDDDGDGLVDEDGVGGWALPFAPTTSGSDVGQTFAFVEDAGKTLRVDLFKPAVFFPNKVYSPTVWFQIVNSGTVPVIITDIKITLVPPYELWDRNGDAVIVDVNNNGKCDLAMGDECTAPLVAIQSGLAVGDILDPNVPDDGVLKIYMTPAANPGVVYSLTIQVTGHNYNEP